MEHKRLSVGKVFVCYSNFLFLISGFVVSSLGVILMFDNERVLLSRLLGSADFYTNEPLFYYASLIIVGVGFIITSIGLFGCWTASCIANCCATSSYIISLVVLLLGELSIYILAVFWPHVLGIDIRPGKLIRALQRNYALPGREQLTAAIDLAQTTFSCCGINASSNYGTSWWRLQEVGRRELVVPLTCCILNNTESSPHAFLNPQPKDLQLCQTLDPLEHQRARHTTACLDMIEKWSQEQAFIFLSVGLIIMVVEMSALLSITLAYSKYSKLKNSSSQTKSPITFTSTQTLTRHPSFALEPDYSNFELGVNENHDNTIHATGRSTTFTGKS